MAKQLMISVMEDVIGEYILNISKENLKIAALKGKVKLEDVQLDGELIGSHVLGAVGLSGFGVLSCWAKSCKIIVPIKNLEKEPTRFEIDGVHLLCVPLLPSTAHRQYGAGTAVDPRCSLRTRAKRSALARYERNFFSGRIPGEGPPTRRMRTAMKHAEREMRKNRSSSGSRWRSKRGTSSNEDFDDESFSDLESSIFGESPSEEKKSGVPENLLSPQLTWKVKLREKVLRNIEATCVNMHVRCEISEGGLDFSHPGHERAYKWRPREREKGEIPADQRAFALGFHFDSMVVRTAQEGQGFNKADDSSSDGASSSSRSQGATSSMTGDVKNKVAAIESMSLYWDDQPPFLLSECQLLCNNNHNLSSNKLQSRIAAAMDAMVTHQDPGEEIRYQLMRPDGSPMRKSASELQGPSIPHVYCIEPFSFKINGQLGDRNQPGPMLLLAQFLPFAINFEFRPNQLVQYNKLRSAMFSQQRFDTMLRQRPASDPESEPRLWWKYVIACVTSRPNSRPWEDVVRIVKNRARYIELVKKKVTFAADGNGFHGGLRDEESRELLRLEDLLPIEALLTFHLLALRDIYDMRKKAGKDYFDKAENEDMEQNGAGTKQPPRTPRLSNPFRRSRKSPSCSPKVVADADSDDDVSKSKSNLGYSKDAVFQAIEARVGKKQWHNTFFLDEARIRITLVQSGKRIVQTEVRANGEARTFGPLRGDFAFNVTHFEIVDPQRRLSKFTPHDTADQGKILMFEEVHRRDGRSMTFPKNEQDIGIDMDVGYPLPGVVCRLTANKDTMSMKLGVAGHPPTLVWNKPCVDAVVDFFSSPTAELRTEVTKQLRNVATPLARKAQLALMSPIAFVLNVNVAAPKVWFPISKHTSDGAVFLDTGMFQMSIAKQESKTDTVWNLSAREINLNFVRPTRSGGKRKSRRESLPIVHPVHVNIEAVLAEKELELPFWNSIFNDMTLSPNKGPWRKVDVSISEIRLNLVDAEVIARAIGKWYSNGLVKVKKLSANDQDRRKKKKDTDHDVTNQEPKGVLEAGVSHGVGIISVKIERFEVALEGHSKMTKNVGDDASVASFLSESDKHEPKTRTYFLELLGVSLGRLSQHGTARTKFVVSDVRIIRIKDNSKYNPMSPNYEFQELQHCILIRCEKDASTTDPSKEKSFSPQNSPQRGRQTESSLSRLEVSNFSSSFDRNASGVEDDSAQAPFLSVSLLHDGSNHYDEVEIDMNSVVLRVTPTTLKDCSKGIRRILELIQLATRELERNVHEEGRKARLGQQDAGDSPKDNVMRPQTPAFSDPASDIVSGQETSDSSILFKVTLHEMTLLIGRPLHLGSKSSPSTRSRTAKSHAVVQLVSNALVMFQSVENVDGSGGKTLHASIDNLSASANTEFTRLSPTSVAPMIGPVAAEFRIVYGTENLGSVVSQDIALDCEALKASLTPNDIFIIKSVVDKTVQRMENLSFTNVRISDHSPRSNNGLPRSKPKFLNSLLRYQKKGSGIATAIRLEIHRFSFVLLEAYRSKQGTRPLFDFRCKAVKLNLGGCMTALSGDCTASFSVNHFNYYLSEWESTVDPVQVTLTLEQMPNEILMTMATTESVQTNVTSIMLKDYLKADFSILRTKSDNSIRPLWNDVFVDPSTLSTIGLRRATEAHSVCLKNETGLDIMISPSIPVNNSFYSGLDGGFATVTAGSEVLLDACFQEGELERTAELLSNSGPKLTLDLAPSAIAHVGQRETIIDLPICASMGHTARLQRLVPRVTGNADSNSMRMTVSGNVSRTASPETVASNQTNFSQAEYAYYNAEPVVEWCMQNQRLRGSIADVYSLSKGRDLMSSIIWSPGDERFAELETDMLESDVCDSVDDEESVSPIRKAKTTTTRPSQKNNWVRPYLKNDSPEWTDMTCILRMARERVMLPDNTWIWLNDWTVDLSGAYGEATDCDGWEYEADFETFNRDRRFYQRGDACRRRRWTRTRVVRPPMLSDPRRPLFLVWETSRDGNDNFVVTVKSHVKVVNNTGVDFSLFVSSPSWKEECLGLIGFNKTLYVPVRYAAATHIRLGVARGKGSIEATKQSMSMSRRIMIIPTGYTSSLLTRTVVTVNPSDGEEVYLSQDTDRKIHLLVHITSINGIVEVKLDPVMRIVNLLPCQLECDLGESIANTAFVAEQRRVIGSKGRAVASKELLSIGIGEDGRAVGVNPCLKPHISLRVPGYHWSAWHRIVNRQSSSCTWQPPDAEHESHLTSSDSDADVDEVKTIIFFKRLGNGDPLNVIVSVEVGHCPTIRVYAQYWILDKTGFGCRFTDSFNDIIGASPDLETSRRSHLPASDAKNKDMKKDMSIVGHQWSLGKDGMTMYFSRREKLALSIEDGFAGHGTENEMSVKSSWVSPMDISNVIPKTVFHVDEFSGHRRFELAISVTGCPSIFSRTKLITLYPRYQIVNMLDANLIIAQDGWQRATTRIKPRSSIPYHWERQALPSKVRLGHAVATSDHDILWTNGCIQLDKIGITSMRFPVDTDKQPMVVQAEVRLATKEQSSAVVVVIWSTDAKSNPLYILKNSTPHTILCRQPLQDDLGVEEANETAACGRIDDKQEIRTNAGFECGVDFTNIINAFLGWDRREEFVWVLQSEEKAFFGFDDPEKRHVLEWTCVEGKRSSFDKRTKNAFVEVDAMGSYSMLTSHETGDIKCHIRAEHSTKVIEFIEVSRRHKSAATMQYMKHGGKHFEAMLDSSLVEAAKHELDGGDDDEEKISFSLSITLPSISISIIDNGSVASYGREILLVHLDSLFFQFSQNRDGYHEIELTLMTLQVDNHVQKSIHPLLVFCPRLDESEPLIHMSAVRRLQPHSLSLAFLYAAIRILDIEIYLDRRTAENIASFIQPLGEAKEEHNQDPGVWISDVTNKMGKFFRKGEITSADVDTILLTANSSRIYIEELHLHPVRLGLTFTQEWMEWKPGGEQMLIFQFIRGMASIANAPLTFTSFVVSHVFESPHALVRIVWTHYSSQLTKQIFGIVGSLAILGAPADFISNVGTGVRDFFYEPINGLVHGPGQFLEGLEAGTQSLARGVFVGVVRGAANVTEVVNANLAGLTADDEFIDQRKAHQRMLTDAMSRGESNRNFSDSLYLAGASVARGVKSGAYGIWEQPAHYASKHGPVGLVKGVGKALVGAIVKPVVGVGDAAVLVMNHVSDATSDKQVLPKIPRRLRRALPRATKEKAFSVRLVPYDIKAAKAQQIVTGGETLDDVYIGHVSIPSHLLIASDQRLWAIDKGSRVPWNVSWEEISHFAMQENDKMRITVFGQTGLRSYVFEVDDAVQFADFYKLLNMQANKMGNATNTLSELDNTRFHGGLLENISRYEIPGVKSRQVNHVFGSCNNTHKRLHSTIKDEIDVIEQCFARVKKFSSSSREFFKSLDEEAWALVNSWGQVFSGLSSRRCIAASIINGTGFDIQIKSTKLVEGGSPCYTIPTQEFDAEQGVLHPGGAIIFFGWGVVPNLLQAGNVFMTIETNAFVADLSDHKGRDTLAENMPGYQVGFLEKSYDENSWWAKYWLLVRKARF